jgi:hypothetical protein
MYIYTFIQTKGRNENNPDKLDRTKYSVFK